MMMNVNRRYLCAAAGWLTAFALWTAAVSRLDVRQIGPRGSAVGLAALNAWVHRLTGVHMTLYYITDWLGLVPVAVACGFAILGLVQLIRRKSLLRVDRSILLLGGFYIIVLTAYLLFETVVINYRPVLIEGRLEASYPSSTTILVLCVMPAAMLQLRGRVKDGRLRRTIIRAMAAFTVFMVVGRTLSGVHWFSDITGGILLSCGLVALYAAVSGLPAAAGPRLDDANSANTATEDNINEISGYQRDDHRSLDRRGLAVGDPDQP